MGNDTHTAGMTAAEHIGDAQHWLELGDAYDQTNEWLAVVAAMAQAHATVALAIQNEERP